MINPLLEELDPARRPLLFCGISGCCASKRGIGLNAQIQLLRNRQFARILLNRRKQLRQSPSAIGDTRGVS